ncbi:MAG: hypothetical protein NDI94_00635 [Candidatus Woesearchaeota archaeon]|nr:hypothetical protein [Candidatus Woesearchaeota archaeon]
MGYHDFETLENKLASQSFTVELTAKELNMYLAIASAFAPHESYDANYMGLKFYRAITRMIDLGLIKKKKNSKSQAAEYQLGERTSNKFKRLANLNHSAERRFNLYDKIAEAYASIGNPHFTKREMVKHFRDGIKEMMRYGIIQELPEEEGRRYVCKKKMQATKFNPCDGMYSYKSK